jgi:hypothetical protein
MGLRGLKSFVFNPSAQKAFRYRLLTVSRTTLFSRVWAGARKYQNNRENQYADYNERYLCAGDSWHDLVGVAVVAFVWGAIGGGIAGACLGIGNGWKRR